MPITSSDRIGLAFVVVALVIALVGCRAPTTSTLVSDTTISRASIAAKEAFAEADVEQAIGQYRKAIRRAWAIDDPYESGTAAYHLAACFSSENLNSLARDWLIDARAELCRAGRSAGNTWLLEAKIAQDENRLEDVARLIDLAVCASPPCDPTGRGAGDWHCSCGPADACRQSCVTQIPCVGAKLQSRADAQHCVDGFDAQVHLARSRLAAEMYDIPVAKHHFQQACELAEDVCSHDLQAELQHVAAWIHLAQGEHRQAAWHFDNEAKHLRLAANYREIPRALELAAAAYEQAELPELAASRLSRVARIWYGRGNAKNSWAYIQRAGALLDACDCDAEQIRLALVASEIQRTLVEDSQPLPPRLQDSQMLSPTNESQPSIPMNQAVDPT